MNHLTFNCSASCGDIIYSLIAVKRLCEQAGKQAIYYIWHNDRRYSKARHINTLQALQRLVQSQGYIAECREWAGEEVAYDLDRFRKSSRTFNTEPLPLRFLDAVGLEPWEDWQAPWLDKPHVAWHHGFNLLNVTERYTAFKVDWRNLVPVHETAFIGTAKEHAFFQDYRHFETQDLYEVAKLMCGAKDIYCNQSAVLTIAQGLGLEVHLAKDRRFNNTIVGNQTKLLC